MRLSTKATLATLAALLMIIPSLCAAQTSTNYRLTNFFSPLQAKVIMTLEDGILIDKGGAEHIAPGDIFVTVKSEKRLTDPQTGQLLDTIFTYGAKFEVTRIKQQLAYCTALDSQPQPAAGTKVRRFENIPISFEDQPGQGFELYRSLREELSHLKWGEYLTGTSTSKKTTLPSLLIRYTGLKLQVLNQKKQIIFSQPYTLSSSQTNSPGTALPTALNPISIPSVASLKPLKSDGIETKKLIRVQLPANMEIQALKISDIDQDGQVDAILGFSHELLVGKLAAGKFIEKSRLILDNDLQIVDISTVDLNQNGRNEIIISALQDNEAKSVIYEYVKNTLHKITESRLLFATFSTNTGDEFLIATDEYSLLEQSPRFYRIKLKDKRVQKSSFDLPKAHQPYGLAQISDSQGHPYLAQLTESNRLTVSNTKGENLWISGDNYGGATVHFNIPQPGSRNAGDDNKLFIQTKLKKTASETLLVSKHSGPKLFKNSPNYKNGRIIELRWNGFNLEEIAKTENLAGRIADFDLIDVNNDKIADLVAAVIYKAKGFFSKPVSGLVIIPGK